MSVCWLCPGQGSQSPEMFGRLVADARVGPHLRRLAAGLTFDALAIGADAGRCFVNRHAQPLIVLYGLAVAAALEEAGIEAGLVAGYSVGELTAHAVAGALAPEAVLALAGERAACMDACAPPEHGMLAVRGVRLATIEALAASAGAVVAIRNGADHAVLAGPNPALARIATELERLGAHVVPLRITVPAHSHWLAEGGVRFTAALAAAPWQAHRAPVVAGIDGRPVSSAAEAIDTLGRQISTPIDWARALDVAVEMGASAFFELGPGSALTRMVREHTPALSARAFEEFASLEGAIAWLRRLGG